MDLNKLIKDNKVALIGYDNCPYTNESARLLDSLGVSYKRVNMQAKDDLHNQLAKDTNRLTTPYIYLNGQFLGAESDLDMLMNSNKLYELLSKAGVKFEVTGKTFGSQTGQGQETVKKVENA